MALILVKENGTGLSNANSYADAVDGEDYHEAHLYNSAWTGASAATKEAALVMATRLIDGSYQFNGYRASDTQALQWPRQHCPDPDKLTSAWSAQFGIARPEFDSDKIPKILVDATCEVARELIKADSTDAVEGEGISRLSIADAISIQFDKKDKQPTISRTAQLFLNKLGNYLPRSGGMTKLVRV